VSLDPYVDAYSIHYYYELFDWMEPRAGFEQLRMGVDRDTARWADYCRHRGKPLLMTEVGTFAFGRGEDGGDPAGPTRTEAALLTAETVVRGLNAGLDAAAFWALFWPAPDTGPVPDAYWATLHIRNGLTEPVPHPYYTYRLLSRHVRPGSVVHPLMSDEAGSVRHVHGSWLIGPDGKPVVILINDHFTETQAVELILPAGCEVAAWSWLSKDAVRIDEPPCTLANTDNGRLSAELAPMSLNVWQPIARYDGETRSVFSPLPGNS
jgi:hypothetical protein